MCYYIATLYDCTHLSCEPELKPCDLVPAGSHTFCTQTGADFADYDVQVHFYRHPDRVPCLLCQGSLVASWKLEPPWTGLEISMIARRIDRDTARMIMEAEVGEVVFCKRWVDVDWGCYRETLEMWAEVSR